MLQYLSYYSWTELFMIVTLVVTTFSGPGLVAIWAGLGRWHWFFRMVVVVAVIAIPLIIPAYELVVVFLVQSAFTILPLVILRRVQRRTTPAGEEETAAVVLGRAQLFLRDLLLVTVIAALISAIFAQIPREIWADWRELVLGGIGLAILTLGGAWVGLGRSRLWLRLILLCLFFPAALIALFLGLVRTASRSDSQATSSPSIQGLARAAVALLALLILFPPGLACYGLLNPRPIPKTPSLTGPNGYPNLVQAARPFANVMLPTDTSPHKPLKPFVVQYRGVLDKAHAAVQRPCQVSLRYDSRNMPIRDFEEARQLARAFYAEGLLAHREGRDNEATQIFLDEFRLGDAVSRGGLLIHMLVGWAIEGIGSYGIAEIRGSLSADQCRGLIDTLQKIEAEREPLEDVFAREEAWDDHAYGWQGRLIGLFYRAERLSAKSGVEYVRTRIQAKMQLLLAELALRRYRLEHGKLPEALTDLVPQYLPAVPQDPFSGKPLIYRRTPTGHLLYSIGPDRKDDGGQPVTSTSWQEDLLLDEPSAGKTK